MKNLILFTFLLASWNFSAKAQLGPTTDICMVTVDTMSTGNYVVWERASQVSPFPIDSIKIYRVDFTGMPILVASVHYDSLSEYHDTSVDPNLHEYTYYITGVDDQGVEGLPSTPHTTIHFSVLDGGTGSFHLVWTPYIGAPVTTYRCWRDSFGVGLGANDQLVENAANTATDWWDNNPPATAWWNQMDYRVDVDWVVNCESTRASHNTTRSNRTKPEAGVQSTGEPTLLEMMVFPNPAGEVASYQFSSTTLDQTRIELVDMNGRIVLQENPIRVLGQYKGQINTLTLAEGMYTLRISNGSGSVHSRLVVAH